ncbi:tyrosine-type recombinase/integrase [Brevibacillus dissolubilis]|uniref:tyrosine-type recombinase/integrase n=1 Tax=Brevibacillus dissolubilis TaxID=1844116 RepID=UPI00210042EA|nr:tyrosine-type recombinase/integrase [Brevibacillus dissolubilis]
MVLHDLNNEKVQARKNPAEVTTSRRFIQDQVINQSIKPKTLQRRISCLKSLSQFCLKEKWIDTDFMAGIQAPKADKKVPVYMKLLELQKLFRYLESDQSKYAVRNHLIFKLLATTGMRRQECIDLNWDQIDIEGQTVRVMGKGKKEHLIPLHPMVIPLIYHYSGRTSATKKGDGLIYRSLFALTLILL